MEHRYLTDESGERTAVVLSIEEYEELLERLEDAEAVRAFDEDTAAIERGDLEFVRRRPRR